MMMERWRRLRMMIKGRGQLVRGGKNSDGEVEEDENDDGGVKKE